jgi:hypothetical protein
MFDMAGRNKWREDFNTIPSPHAPEKVVGLAWRANWARKKTTKNQ